MNNEEATSAVEQTSSVSQEGAGSEPTTDEVQKLYDDLGVKAKAPTDKGRPKATNVRTKNVQSKDDADSDGGEETSHKNSKSQSKDAQDSDGDGDSGSKNSSKQSQKSQKDGEVSGESEEAGEGVRSSKSKTGDDAERRGSEESDSGHNRDGQEEHDEGDSEEEEREAGKRPGKSNPEIEKRFQRLTNDVRQRDDVIADLQQKLQDITQRHTQAQVDYDDPEYTIDDFRGDVQDADGNIVRLSEEQAELAYRRWADGYNARAQERASKAQFEAELQKSAQQHQYEAMQRSVEAYDTLTGMVDTYPALNPKSPEFDQELSDDIMPIIKDAIIYQEGTEPGNPNGYQPTIVGMKMNPSKILDVINKVQKSKRALPLNGVNDNVDAGSSVSVPHGRSSDPTVREANDLMKHFGISKRF